MLTDFFAWFGQVTAPLFGGTIAAARTWFHSQVAGIQGVIQILGGQILSLFSAIAEIRAYITQFVNGIQRAIDAAVEGLRAEIDKLWDFLKDIPGKIFGWVADSVVGHTEKWFIELPGRLWHAKPPGELPPPEELHPQDTLGTLLGEAEGLFGGAGHWIDQELEAMLADLSGLFPTAGGRGGPPGLPPPGA